MDSLEESPSTLGTGRGSGRPELRVEHTAGLCQPVSLYLAAADGSELANLLRSRVGHRLAARMEATDVAIRLVPAMAGYEPWTADPLDPFSGEPHDEIAIGIPPERIEAIAAACEGPQGTYTWPWFPELKIVRY